MGNIGDQSQGPLLPPDTPRQSPTETRIIQLWPHHPGHSGSSSHRIAVLVLSSRGLPWANSFDGFITFSTGGGSMPSYRTIWTSIARWRPARGTRISDRKSV